TLLAERDEAGEEEQLQPAVEVGGFQADAAEEEVYPLAGGELPAPGAIGLQVEGRELHRLQILDPERAAFPARLLIEGVDEFDLRPDAAHEQPVVLADVLLGDVDEAVAEVDQLGPV